MDDRATSDELISSLMHLKVMGPLSTILPGCYTLIYCSERQRLVEFVSWQATMNFHVLILLLRHRNHASQPVLTRAWPKVMKHLSLLHLKNGFMTGCIYRSNRFIDHRPALTNHAPGNNEAIAILNPDQNRLTRSIWDKRYVKRDRENHDMRATNGYQ